MTDLLEALLDALEELRVQDERLTVPSLALDRQLVRKKTVSLTEETNEESYTGKPFKRAYNATDRQTAVIPSSGSLQTLTGWLLGPARNILSGFTSGASRKRRLQTVLSGSSVEEQESQTVLSGSSVENPEQLTERSQTVEVQSNGNLLERVLETLEPETSRRIADAFEIGNRETITSTIALDKLYRLFHSVGTEQDAAPAQVEDGVSTLEKRLAKSVERFAETVRPGASDLDTAILSQGTQWNAEPVVGRGTMDLRELDRRLERDARRYDGGIRLY